MSAAAPAPIFVDLSESKPTEIESLCMKCHENVSRLIACFKRLVKKHLY